MAYTPASADDNQPRLPSHSPFRLIFLIIQIHLDDRQILLTTDSRFETQGVTGHTIDMPFRVGKRIMNQNCASEESEAKNGRQNEPDADRYVRMFASKLL